MVQSGTGETVTFTKWTLQCYSITKSHNQTSSNFWKISFSYAGWAIFEGRQGKEGRDRERKHKRPSEETADFGKQRKTATEADRVMSAQQRSTHTVWGSSNSFPWKNEKAREVNHERFCWVNSDGGRCGWDDVLRPHPFCPWLMHWVVQKFSAWEKQCSSNTSSNPKFSGLMGDGGCPLECFSAWCLSSARLINLHAHSTSPQSRNPFLLQAGALLRHRGLFNTSLFGLSASVQTAPSGAHTSNRVQLSQDKGLTPWVKNTGKAPERFPQLLQAI